MPDITLYREDVEIIRRALIFTSNTLTEYARKGVGLDVDAKLIKDCERVRDLLLDRLVQQLHPARETGEKSNAS